VGDQRFSDPTRTPTEEVSLSSNDIWRDMMLEGELTLGGGPATPRSRQPDRPKLGASNSPGSCFVAPQTSKVQIRIEGPTLFY
jgi:hypothetical protein